MVLAKNELYVYDLMYNKLAILNDNSENGAKNIEENYKINSIDTISFTLPFGSDKWKYLLNENLIKWKDEYYFIKVPRFTHNETTKEVRVECRHLSCGLEGITCSEFELIGKKADELMSEVLTGTGWTVGNIDLSEVKYRSLITSEQSAFTNLIKIAELFEAKLVFNSRSRTVDLTDKWQDRNIQIRKGKNLQSVEVSYDTNEIVTRLYVFGGDDPDSGMEVNIMSVNPTGKSYIEDYSYFIAQGYTQEYINAHPELFRREMTWNATEYLDEQSLYDDAVSKLTTLCKPKVKCSVSGLDLSMFPEHFIESPAIGETVYILDVDLDLIINARVTEIKKQSDKPLGLQITISNEIEYNSVAKQIMDSTQTVGRVVNPKDEIRGQYIKEATIDDAHIKNLDALKIKTGTLDADRIKASVIEAINANIGTAKINSAVIEDLEAFTIQAGSVTTDKLYAGGQLSNVALNKNVTITSGADNGVCKQDLNNLGFWSTTTFPSSMTVDLGSQIEQIMEVSFDTWQPNDYRYIPYSYKLEWSTDNFTWNTIADVINNRYTSGLSTFTRYSLDRVTARYIRLTVRQAQQSQTKVNISLFKVNSVFGGTVISGDTIKTGKIDAEEVQVVNLDADNIKVGKISAELLTSTIINAINASIETAKINSAKIGQLDVENLTTNVIKAINASIGTATIDSAKIGSLDAGKITSGIIDAERLTADVIKAVILNSGIITAGSGIIANGAIGNAHINDVNADKLKAGTIDTTSVTVQGTDGRLKISGNRLQVFDEDAKKLLFERVAVGDVNGDGSDYGLLVRGKDGKTIFINQDGITEAGFTDGYNKVPDGSLDGTKLDINTVITSINNGTTTINSSKVFLNEKTLDVAFSEIKDTQTSQGQTISNHSSQLVTLAGEISSKVSSQTYETFVNDINNKVDAIEFVGRNLLSQTSFSDDSPHWAKTDGATINTQDRKAILTANGTDVSIDAYPLHDFEPNTTYTLSANFKDYNSVGGNGLRVYYSLNGVWSFKQVESNFEGRFSVTFVTPSTFVGWRISFDSYNTTSGKCEIWNIKLEKGSKATDWTPAPEDIEEAVSTAQTSANTANSLLSDIASDSKLTAVEKQSTKKEWDIIVAEKTSIEAQATAYGITTEKTNYTNSYNALNTYITPLLSNLTTTSNITGSDFRAKFKDYYDKRTLLLKAVSDKAKGLTDGLSERLTTAETKITQTDEKIELKASKTELEVYGKVLTIDNTTDTLFHFDKNLCSTNGVNPNSGYVVTMRNDGKFGGAVAVEEGTTNLVTNPFFDANWGENPAFITKTVEDVDFINGQRVKALKLQYTGSGDGYSSHSITMSSVANKTFTLSFWIKADGNGAMYERVFLQELGNTFRAITTTKSFTSLPTQWTYVTLTGTAPSDCANTVRIIFRPSANTTSAVYYTMPQLEQKPFATSFVNGVRANGVLKYILNDLNPNLFTINWWMKTNTIMSASSFYINFFRNTPTQFDLSNRVYIRPDNASTIGYGEVADGVTKTRTTITFKDIDKWNMWTLKGETDGKLYLYTNGIKLGTYTLSDTTRAINSIDFHGANASNFILDELLTTSKALSDTEIKAIYDLQKPLFDPNPKVSVPNPNSVSISFV